MVSGWVTATSEKGTIHIFGVHKEFHLAQRTETGGITPVAGIDEVRVVRENGLYTSERFSENPRSMFSFLKPLLPNYFMSEFSFAQFRI